MYNNYTSNFQKQKKKKKKANWQQLHMIFMVPSSTTFCSFVWEEKGHNKDQNITKNRPEVQAPQHPVQILWASLCLSFLFWKVGDNNANHTK